MKIFPYDRFQLISSYSKHDAIEHLQRNTAPTQLFRFSKPNEAYTGSVYENGFKISPTIEYRNSFKPVIVGNFLSHHSGVKISVTQRLHLVVIIFLITWIVGVVGIGGLISLVPMDSLSDGPPENQFFRIVPLGMLLFVWMLTTGGFWWEARHTKEALMKFLDATEDQSL